MPILLFFIFVAVVVVCTLALGCGLSALEGPTMGRRCRMPREMHHRKRVRRQRVRCRFRI